jgi:hypothetical protein
MEQVERQLAAANGDAAAIRGKLVAILQTGLAKFGGQNAANGAAEKIDSASDEEIFALIDNEL